MKLYSNPASPFARKARIIVRELNLTKVVEEVNIDTRNPPPDFRSINPLGKIPVLVLKDGSTILDSPVICEYLNDMGGGKFFPGMSIFREVSGRWKALTLQALGDGICDAAVARVYETRRPAEQQSPEALQKHLTAIETGLTVLERAKFSEKITIGEITVACAIGYLDFRMPELAWRNSRPKLRDWYEAFAQYPSMKDTWPEALA
ncbi:glutathione S-transferase [Rhizomicrobium palustre]|uniref:Glutathione S-transferase n=1 Tax=Rhizomicrobium palustre TaxID=189966 RepID=A0A846MXL5_9PROT|nr:glutathione S-transferase [Rhizomicrobium palustre]NIK87760.1 glutathione S-transferase [Rhizomicrobium palustre]